MNSCGSKAYEKPSKKYYLSSTPLWKIIALGKQKFKPPTELHVRKCNGGKPVGTWRDRKEGPANNLKQGQVHSKMSVGHSCGGIQDHKVWWSFSLNKKRCVCYLDGNSINWMKLQRGRKKAPQYSWKWLCMNCFIISNWHLIIIFYRSSSLVLTQPNNCATHTS